MSTLIGTATWLKRTLVVNHNKANNHLEHLVNSHKNPFLSFSVPSDEICEWF